MKKTKFAFLSLILALSFAVTSFAAPAIDYIVKDTIDGKEYYVLFGSYDDVETPSEIGITFNGTDYSLSLPSMIELPKSKRFAMAVSDENNLLGDEFKAVPYARDDYGIKTEGEEVTVTKSEVNAPRNYNNVVASNVLSAYYANDWGILQSLSKVNTIFIETDSRANLGFTMDPIGVALLKIDLTKLTDCDINRKFIMNFKGYNINGDLDHMTFSSYIVDSSWDDISTLASETPGLFYKTYAYEKVPMDTVTVSNDSLDFSIDISAAVFHALKAGKKEAVVALAPDNTESKKLSLENGQKYDTTFNFNVEGNNAPTISYYTEDKSGYTAELTYIKAGDTYLAGLYEGKTEFNVYLPYGTEVLPHISAEADKTDASLEITQATMENKKATVLLTPQYGGEGKIYTVNYIISNEKVANTYSFRQSADNVFSACYSIDPLTKISAPDQANIKTDGNGISAVESKGNTDNLQDSLIFMQLDLSKLSGINKGSPVMLKLHGELLSDAENVTSTDLEIYPVSEDIWSTLNDADFKKGIMKAMDIEGVIGNKKPIASKTLTKAGGYWFTTSIGDHELDISSYVAYCLDNNQTHATIALRVKPMDIEEKYTARFRMWHDRTYITYSDKDMSGYEKEIGTIKVDGNTLYQFDKNTLVYKYYVPYGTETYPVVSATALKGNVSVTQATKENPVATVVLAPEYAAGETVEYVVSFVEGDKAAEEATSLACSWTGVISDGFSIDPNYSKNNDAETNKEFVYHSFNGAHNTVYNPWSGAYNIMTSVAYLKLDLSKLVDLNKGQPVYFDIYGVLGSTDAAIEYRDLELYSVDDSVWSTVSSEDLAVSASAALDVDSAINEKNYINKVAVPRTAADLWSTTGLAIHRIDITQFVNYCIDNGIMTPTVAVRIKPVDVSNTAMRFRFFTNSSDQSKITYYKNSVEE